MKRSRIRRKPRRGDKPRVREEYRDSHSQCAICGRRNGYDPNGQFYVLDVSHILGGRYGRVDDPRNLYLGCRAVQGLKDGCHDLQHASQISLAQVLSAKKRVDPELYDRQFLESLMGNRRLPETAVIIEE